MFTGILNQVIFTSGTECLLCVHADIALTSLSTGVALGIAVITGTIALVVGVLAGVLLHHCIIKYRSQSSKADSTSHQQQQTGPEYEEVPVDKKIELRENVAYGPAQSIELKVSEAYGHVQH